MINDQTKTYKEHNIEWSDEKVSRLWDYYSRTLPYSEMYFSKTFGSHILKKSNLPLKEKLEVLDFGCGPGFIWDHLNKLESHWQYTALDFSKDSVLKVLGKGRGNSHFKAAEHVHSLPTSLKQESFDIVLLFEVVEHLNDTYLDNTLTEVVRLLKKGGVVVITTPNNEDINYSKKFCPDCGAIFHEWQHVRSWSVATLTNHLEQYGLKLRKAETLDFAMIEFTPLNVLRKMRHLSRILLKKNLYNPHMITVFQKV